jgi:hypothetical protein
MADSLGLSPIARQQLGVNVNEKITNLREYLEIREEDIKENEKTGQEHTSGGTRKMKKSEREMNIIKDIQDNNLIGNEIFEY